MIVALTGYCHRYFAIRVSLSFYRENHASFFWYQDYQAGPEKLLEAIRLKIPGEKRNSVERARLTEQFLHASGPNLKRDIKRHWHENEIEILDKIQFNMFHCLWKKADANGKTHPRIGLFNQGRVFPVFSDGRSCLTYVIYRNNDA